MRKLTSERPIEKSFQRSLGQLSEVFGFADTFIAAEQIEPDYVGTIHLVLEEIFTNLVKYNQRTRSEIKIRLSLRRDQLRMSLIDTDVDDFDITTLPAPNLRAGLNERRPGGLGIYLVHRMTDRVTYEYKDRVSKITVTKKLVHCPGSSRG